MKHSLSLKPTIKIITVIFALMFATVTHSAQPNLVGGEYLTVEKYKIGITSNPFSGMAAWKYSATEYRCLRLNQSELLEILSVAESGSIVSAGSLAISISSPAPLTAEEQLSCNEITKSFTEIWIVRHNPSDKTPPNTSPLYDSNNKIIGRIAEGMPCGKQIGTNIYWRECTNAKGQTGRAYGVKK